MSTSPNSRSENPSTYFIQDRSNKEELVRVDIQDRMMTASMGGVLPEQPDPTIFQRILDVGCGTGRWLIEVAKTYPDLPTLIGVDANRNMLEAARSFNETEGVGKRVEFQMMDALRMLEFPDRYFDLVNQRFAASWLRTWDWRKLLQEYRRIARPGGIIRITEPDITIESDSCALSRLCEFMVQAMTRAGYLFTQRGDGVTTELASLFEQHGIQQVQTRPYVLTYSSDTEAGQLYIEDITRIYRTSVPFLRKWTRLPNDYEEIYQQMARDLRRPDFVATVRILTVWGKNPSKQQYQQNEVES